MEEPTVRSYRIRGTRITGPQQIALDKHWGDYGIEQSQDRIDLQQLFPEAKEVIMEIGFGMGEATALIGKAFPEKDLLQSMFIVLVWENYLHSFTNMD